MTVEGNAAGPGEGPAQSAEAEASAADALVGPGAGKTGVAEARASSQQKSKPTTIQAILELAYGDEGAKRMEIDSSAFRNEALALLPGAVEVESARLRELAASDPLMSAPPKILVALAENRSRDDVRRRLLDLVQEAMVAHPVFEGLVGDGPLGQPQPGAEVTARHVRERAREVASTEFVESVSPEVRKAWGQARTARESARLATTGSQHQQSELKRKASDLQQRALEGERRVRRQLEVNAVATFALHRVMCGAWTLAKFVEQTEREIWGQVELARLPERDAAVLVMATQKRPLGILTGVYQSITVGHLQRTRAAQHDLARERDRADAAERTARELSAEVRDAVARAADLEARYAALRTDLAAERDSRVVDKSHLVNDYEVLRTQVLRRLTSQTELLADGLHALRAGSTEVAEEFVDRALTAIQSEVARLKSQGGAR